MPQPIKLVDLGFYVSAISFVIYFLADLVLPGLVSNVFSPFLWLLIALVLFLIKLYLNSKTS